MASIIVEPKQYGGHRGNRQPPASVAQPVVNIVGYESGATAGEKRGQDVSATPVLAEDTHPTGVQVYEQRCMLVEEIQVGSLPGVN